VLTKQQLLIAKTANERVPGDRPCQQDDGGIIWIWEGYRKWTGMEFGIEKLKLEFSVMERNKMATFNTVHNKNMT
jgi:hypothetical protein